MVIIKIFINPGHCPGADSGAVGFGITEAETALKIGEKVQRLLINAGEQAKLFQYDGLQEICDASDNFNADIFVSIHCNAFNGAAHGVETWYYPTSSAGKNLALQIQSQIVKNFPTLFDRKIKATSTFYVLRNTIAPAVLVETAFIDNWGDNQLLRYRADDFAKSIAQGILNYG